MLTFLITIAVVVAGDIAARKYMDKANYHKLWIFLFGFFAAVNAITALTGDWLSALLAPLLAFFCWQEVKRLREYRERQVLEAERAFWRGYLK